MTQYNTLNVEVTEVNLKVSLNVVGDSNDETNFPHKLLFTDPQVSRLRNAFGNNSSANIGILGFLVRLLGPLQKMVGL